MDVYVGGKRVRLDPTASIGKGGEADVYKIDSGTALKLFKSPDHPDYEGLPHEQAAARERIATHQRKLRDFPRNLPPRVITPIDLATDRTGGMILGYTMPFRPGEVLLRYSDPEFRKTVPPRLVVSVFIDLHATVDGMHRVSVVIGDFNDLNVLVSGAEANIIDADSTQFGPYFCKVFTARFVDPLRCDPKGDSPILNKPHTADSDWYAFTVMLFQSLLLISPFGGVYRPKNPANRIPHDARPLHRISVFHSDVKYPKAAVPFGRLPDDLLQSFHRMFEKDERGIFPLPLLQALRWTTCTACHTEHARAICPECAEAAPAAVKEVTQVRGQVTATRIFQTIGTILHATIHQGKLLWLYHENETIKREDGTTVLDGDVDPLMRFRIRGNSTLIAKAGQLATLTPGQTPERNNVDSFGSLPVFDANENHTYWLADGRLQRTDAIGPKYMGDVLRGQTLFWVGNAFGFGFYRAGELSVAFVFDAEARGINDTVRLPKLRGQLIDSTCVFGKDLCWFFVATQESGKTIHQCFVIKRDGSIEAHSQTDQGDASWLGTLRGKCAFGDTLFSTTDDGLVRVKPEQGSIQQIATFPDTEPFVNTNQHLFPGREGIYVVGHNQIRILKIR